MRTMTKERKKEGPRLGHKGRADAKASRQLLLLCIPAIIAYILFNYIPMGAAVIIPFKNYKFSKGILGSDWCGLANFNVTSTSATSPFRSHCSIFSALVSPRTISKPSE